MTAEHLASTLSHLMPTAIDRTVILSKAHAPVRSLRRRGPTPCFGCASATRGTTESISIASTPPGATADVSGLGNPTTCVTPCVVQVKRNADITVSINKPGYEPQVVPLTKEVAGAGAAGFAGNVLVGGVVGMGVDAVTGAAMDHKPNPVTVTLQPSRAAAPPRPAKPRTRPPAKPQPQS